MPASWKQLSFVPSPEALQALNAEWRWLTGDALAPFLCAASGDVFFDAPDATVHWLDTGNGKLSCVAADRAAFEAAVRADGGAELLLAPVIDTLLDAGGVLQPGQCFGFRILPVLGGAYDASNMVATDAAGWYGFSGYVHNQLKDLPDGTRVQFTFEPT